MSAQVGVEGGLFDPPGAQFRPVSPNLTKARLLATAIVLIPLAVALIVLAVLTHPAVWATLLVPAGLMIWLGWLIPRQVKALNWALTEDTLFVRKGIMFRSLTSVPLGRLQYVDLEEGPIARWLGMARVKLYTASASTDATIPGIPKAEADWLRQNISQRGQSQLEGL